MTHRLSTGHESPSKYTGKAFKWEDHGKGTGRCHGFLRKPADKIQGSGRRSVSALSARSSCRQERQTDRSCLGSVLVVYRNRYSISMVDQGQKNQHSYAQFIAPVEPHLRCPPVFIYPRRSESDGIKLRCIMDLFIIFAVGMLGYLSKVHLPPNLPPYGVAETHNTVLQQIPPLTSFMKRTKVWLLHSLRMFNSYPLRNSRHFLSFPEAFSKCFFIF